jgi:hypothetical protein
MPADGRPGAKVEMLRRTGWSVSLIHVPLLF